MYWIKYLKDIDINKIKIITFVGTRPDTIKLAPVLMELETRSEIESLLCATGQHREMLDQALDSFSLKPDFDLNVMTKNQNLTDLTTNLLQKTSQLISSEKPHIVIVHGDTTSAYCASLSAFYNNIPIVHVEAGLRTYNLSEPFPEEFNRQSIARLAWLNFAPTEIGKINLIKEGIANNRIHVTGNTVVESLNYILQRLNFKSKEIRNLFTSLELNDLSKFENKIVLITMHRRENIGEGIRQVCKSIIELAKGFSDFLFVFPVHLNPLVRNDVSNELSMFSNIKLLDPLTYPQFVFLLSKSSLIITDSGGIQEEAVSLGKFALVTRNLTERPEGIKSGLLKIVSTNSNEVYESAKSFLDNPKSDQKPLVNPYGSGQISKVIVDKIVSEYNLKFNS